MTTFTAFTTTSANNWSNPCVGVTLGFGCAIYGVLGTLWWKKICDQRQSREAELTMRLNQILVADAGEVQRGVDDALTRIRMTDGGEIDEFLVRALGETQSFLGLGVAAVHLGPPAVLKLLAPLAIVFENRILQGMFGGAIKLSLDEAFSVKGEGVADRVAEKAVENLPSGPEKLHAFQRARAAAEAAEAAEAAKAAEAKKPKPQQEKSSKVKMVSVGRMEGRVDGHYANFRAQEFTLPMRVPVFRTTRVMMIPLGQFIQRHVSGPIRGRFISHN